VGLRKHLNKKIKSFKVWEDCVLDKPQPLTSAGIKVFLKRIYLWSKRSSAIRYVPVIKELRPNIKIKDTILEVGSGPLGLSQHIKYPMTGIDTDISGPRYSHMKLIRSSAEDLQFEDDAYDVVISLDMLEHIPQNKRGKVISEMLRVAKKKVVLGVPVGETAKRWEAKVMAVFKKQYNKIKNRDEKKSLKKRNIFLFQHQKYKLPEETEILKVINECSALKSIKVRIKSVLNESLIVWYFGVLGEMKHNYFRWFLTMVIFIVLFPLLARVRWGGCYRTIFIIDILEKNRS